MHIDKRQIESDIAHKIRRDCRAKVYASKVEAISQKRQKGANVYFIAAFEGRAVDEQDMRNMLSHSSARITVSAT
jgi:hypothetical protein